MGRVIVATSLYSQVRWSEGQFAFGSLAAQVASQSTDSSVRRIAELPWLLIVGESISEFGQQQNKAIN